MPLICSCFGTVLLTVVKGVENLFGTSTPVLAEVIFGANFKPKTFWNWFCILCIHWRRRSSEKGVSRKVIFDERMLLTKIINWQQIWAKNFFVSSQTSFSLFCQSPKTTQIQFLLATLNLKCTFKTFFELFLYLSKMFLIHAFQVRNTKNVLLFWKY